MCWALKRKNNQQHFTPYRDSGLKSQAASFPGGLSFLLTKVLMIYLLIFRSLSLSLSSKTIFPLLAWFFCRAVTCRTLLFSHLGGSPIAHWPPAPVSLDQGTTSGQVTAVDYRWEVMIFPSSVHSEFPHPPGPPLDDLSAGIPFSSPASGSL